MFFASNGNIYVQGIDGAIRPVNVTATDRVVETREIETIDTEVIDEIVELPSDAVTLSMTEIIARYSLSGKNPLMFDKEAHTKRLADFPPVVVETTESVAFVATTDAVDEVEVVDETNTVEETTDTTVVEEATDAVDEVEVVAESTPSSKKTK